MKSCCDEYCSTHGCNQGRDCPVRIERLRQAQERLDSHGLNAIFGRKVRVTLVALVGLVVLAINVAVWSAL